MLVVWWWWDIVVAVYDLWVHHVTYLTEEVNVDFVVERFFALEIQGFGV